MSGDWVCVCVCVGMVLKGGSGVRGSKVLVLLNSATNLGVISLYNSCIIYILTFFISPSV